MAELGQRTEKYSGSDLKEMCRNAAMLPMRELLREVGDDREQLSRLQREVSFVFNTKVPLPHIADQGFELRPLVLEDFFFTDGTSPLPPRYDDSIGSDHPALFSP